MSKRIRAGLIGCGGISRQHIGALMQMDNAEIVAVCDIKPDRLAAAAAQTGAEPMEDPALSARAHGHRRAEGREACADREADGLHD